MNIKILILITISLVSECIYCQPWKNPLKICQSINGANFSNIRIFQDSSGVPNVIRLPSGVLACVFQWFRQPLGSPSWDKVAIKFSSNSGLNWTEPVPIIVNGLPANFTRPFDPTLAVTESGRIRMFFSDGMTMIPDTSVNTYSAISDDGINYTLESGIRFTLPDRPVIDPAAIKFRNLWHLINPISNMTSGGAFHNISNDGLNFNRVQDIPSDMSHSWIGNYMIKDTNELRFYGSGMGIWYATSPNGGEWSSYFSTGIIGGDPSVLKLSDTNYIMIFTGPPYTVSISPGSEIANNFHLYQNYPNPFNPVTLIKYEIPSTSGSGFVSLKVYDVLGNEVATLVNESKPSGVYEVEFSAGSADRNSGNFAAGRLASGIYFYRLTATSGEVKYSETMKMILLK